MLLRLLLSLALLIVAHPSPPVRAAELPDEPVPAIDAVSDPAALRYSVEVETSVAYRSRVVRYTERLTIENVGDAPFDSITLLHYPRAMGAWSDERVSVDGIAVAPTRLTSIAMRIPFTTPVEAGGSAVIEVRGRIALARVRDSFGRLGSRNGFVILGEWLALPGPAVARTRIGDPVSALVADRIDVTVVLDQAMSRSAVQGSGVRLVAPERRGRTWRYAIERARGAAIAIDPRFVERSANDTVNGIAIRGVARTATRAALLAADARGATRAYSGWFGPGPYPTLRVVDTAYTIGQEYPGLVLIGHTALGSHRRLVVRHEVAHQWWYALLASDQVADPWLDESLATFSAAQLGSSIGSNCAARAVDRGPGTFTAFWGCGEYFDVVYRRGLRLWLSLRTELGRDALNGCLRDFVQGHRFARPTGADLVNALVECDPDAESVLERYLSTGLIDRARGAR